jgi:ssDNA-binding Zn-finger/Zn-ribbon topoisomerase 1
MPLCEAPELKCPECGAAMVRRNSRYGLFYGCSRFPECRATHGAHTSTGLPLGIPGNKETKEARMAAHTAFDSLWRPKGAVFARQDAYKWLAEELGISSDKCHIAMFDRETCQKVQALCIARLRS